MIDIDVFLPYAPLYFYGRQNSCSSHRMPVEYQRQLVTLGIDDGSPRSFHYVFLGFMVALWLDLRPL
jgi:hypothetical protein